MPPCSRHGLRCRHTGRSDSRRNTTFRCGYCECRPCGRLGVTRLCIVAGSWRHYDERSRVGVPPARRAGGEATLMSEERELLRETVAALVDKHASPAAVREAMASKRGYDESLWKRLCEQVGAAALVVPEELGGAGGELADAAVVLEELGKALVPTPLLGTTLAELALLAADQADAEAIERLAEGTSIGTVVFDPGYVVNGDVADVVVAAAGTRDDLHRAPCRHYGPDPSTGAGRSQGLRGHRRRSRARRQGGDPVGRRADWRGDEVPGSDR